MGGGMAADLTHGAVAAMVSGLADGLGSVLQVVGAPTVTAIVLSDGVHSLEAAPVITLSGLVTAGLLRSGSVVRILDCLCPYDGYRNRRIFIISRLEILQTECTLIGSPTIYEVNAAQPNKMGSISDRLQGLFRPGMISKALQGVTKTACSGDQGLAAGSSRAARVEEDAVKKRRKFYGLVAAQNTINAKMQQILLSNHGQGIAAGGGSDRIGDTYRTIAQIKDESFRMSSDQPGLITVVAAISHVDTDSFCYPSCGLMFHGEKCSNKLRVDGDGWWCTRCLWRSQTCEYRYMLKCQISDHTGSTNVTVLQEAAEGIIGHTAQELIMLKDVQKYGARFEEIIQGILGRQYVLKLRVEGHGVMMKRNIVEAEKLDSQDMIQFFLAVGNLLMGDSLPAPRDQGAVAATTCPTNLQVGPQTLGTSKSFYGSSMLGTRGASATASYVKQRADLIRKMSNPSSSDYGSMMRI